MLDEVPSFYNLRYKNEEDDTTMDLYGVAVKSGIPGFGESIKAWTREVFSEFYDLDSERSLAEAMKLFADYFSNDDELTPIEDKPTLRFRKCSAIRQIIIDMYKETLYEGLKSVMA